MRNKNKQRRTKIVCKENAGVKPKIIPHTIPAASGLVSVSELSSFTNAKICLRRKVKRCLLHVSSISSHKINKRLREIDTTIAMRLNFDSAFTAFFLKIQADCGDRPQSEITFSNQSAIGLCLEVHQAHFIPSHGPPTTFGR